MLPTVRFSTPVAIVQHVRERYKPTNTGRLFARLAQGTMILSCGQREPQFDPAPLLDPSVDWRLLYPRQGAPPLGRLPADPEGRRLGLVLLDGSWSQCAHLSRRLPVVSALPCVSLPECTPSFWTVRAQPRLEGRSTFEAALAAIEILEGDGEFVRELRRGFALVTARMLFLKGKLRAPEIPSGWRV